MEETRTGPIPVFLIEKMDSMISPGQTTSASWTAPDGNETDGVDRDRIAKCHFENRNGVVQPAPAARRTIKYFAGAMRMFVIILQSLKSNTGVSRHARPQHGGSRKFAVMELVVDPLALH